MHFRPSISEIFNKINIRKQKPRTPILITGNWKTVTRYPETRYPIPGNRNLIPGNRYPIPGNRYPIPGNRKLIPENRNPLPENRKQKTENRYLTPDTSHPETPKYPSPLFSSCFSYVLAKTLRSLFLEPQSFGVLRSYAVLQCSLRGPVPAI